MTALIGLAIIAIWLVVLVPMWLNRHDATDASRSMDSFSTAMRVLSRRAPSQGDRLVVMPRRENWGPTVDNNPDAKFGRRPAGSRRPPISAGAQARMMARRRRVTLVLLTLVLVLFLTAAVGATSWWYELAVVLAAAGYVIHLRGEAIRAREVRVRRQAHAARAASWTPAEEPRQRRQPRDVVAETIVDDEQVLSAEPVSAAGTENGSRWEPVPVPLPTYVSKPVATRPVASAPRADVDATNTIDLTRPGTWSDAQDAEAVGASSELFDQYAPDIEIDHRHLLLDETGSGRIAASPGAPEGAAAAAAAGSAGGSRRPIAFEDDELDVILERRRAVGD